MLYIDLSFLFLQGWVAPAVGAQNKEKPTSRCKEAVGSLTGAKPKVVGCAVCAACQVRSQHSRGTRMKLLAAEATGSREVWGGCALSHG